VEETQMRTALIALSLAASFGFLFCQSAAAVPANPEPIQQAAMAASGVEHTQYAERHTRHGIVKCYREFVFGSYTCHSYPR
jgi:hypothetical protein